MKGSFGVGNNLLSVLLLCIVHDRWGSAVKDNIVCHFLPLFPQDSERIAADLLSVNIFAFPLKWDAQKHNIIHLRVFYLFGV